MVHRSIRPFAAALSAAALLPLGAAAQTGTFYTPPKMLTQATPSVPIAGTGAVTVQVFVKANGQIGTVKVEKSTNHGDDPAALDIAKNSKYKPGSRDGKPIDAFYTMSLKFSGTTVVNDTGTSASQLIQANALIRAGKYAEAKAQVQSYLTGHPGDKDASALLGVSEAYLNDPAGAAAAFDAAGTIPPQFTVIAAKAYSDAAVDALKAKNNDQAITLAQKGLALQQSVNGLFILGTAYANAQRYTDAIADLEKAKSQATAGHADAATLNAIDNSLATAYIFGGQMDRGVALAKALKQRDPSNTRIDDTLAAYYNQQAIAQVKAKQYDAAAATLDSAAAALPSRAAVLYVQAANVLSQPDKPDWKRVKAEADKALAVAPNDPRANYVAGIALANSGDAKGAIPLLQKAKANAGTDPSLNSDIDAALKKLGVKQ